VKSDTQVSQETTVERQRNDNSTPPFDGSSVYLTTSFDDRRRPAVRASS
jgi:hypothetical protein